MVLVPDHWTDYFLLLEEEAKVQKQKISTHGPQLVQKKGCKTGVVVYMWNPSYLGGRDLANHHLRPTPAKSL
jgi:hypothetical protein